MVQSSRLVQFSVWVYLVCSTVGNFDVVNITINGNTADGEMLVNLGTRIKNPLLTLIGMAIRNQYPCSEWGQWTSCTSRHSRYFGTKTRTRTCSTYNTPWGTPLSKTEEDLSVCVGCPTSYNLTLNGNCLKFYRVSKSWEEAEKVCQDDGGHLAYINSDAKYHDLRLLIGEVSSNIWINGRRKDINSHWETSYGASLTKFYWSSGQPSNGSTELCLMTDRYSSGRWQDNECNVNSYCLCEIIA